MSGEEWLACDEPWELARFARGRVEAGRFRFLAVEWGTRLRDTCGSADGPWFGAFVRWVAGAGEHPRIVCRETEWDAFGYLADRDSWTSRFDEALKADDPLTAAACAGEGVSRTRTRPPPLDPTRTHRGRSAKKRHEADAHERAWQVTQEREQAQLRTRFCDEFRDVAGDPFRPTRFDVSWHSSTAVALARVMHETRDFSLMPVLADALQDAGCENLDVLDHCRGPGPHVRGCWVIDLLLGKA